MTVKRIISGEVLKYRNGLRISGDYETRSTGASYFALTVPPPVVFRRFPIVLLRGQMNVCLFRVHLSYG